jgi:hypothetical protein
MPALDEYVAIARDLILLDLSDEDMDSKIDQIDRHWASMTKDERDEVNRRVLSIMVDSSHTYEQE